MSSRAISSRAGLTALAALCCLAASVPARGAAVPHPGGGKVFLTKDEALALAFEGCEVTRRTVALKAEQKSRVAELAGTKLRKSLVYAYVARKDGELVGIAYFDVHKVRAMRETLMVVVDPNDRIARLEVLAFAEPLDYLPRGRWYAQFVGKRLDETLSLKRGIKGITGATLTARATTDAARRALAVHRVLKEAGTFSQPAGR